MPVRGNDDDGRMSQMGVCRERVYGNNKLYMKTRPPTEGMDV
jgi:hypothetical protein